MCVGQCYDGASVMSGACKGVQARICTLSTAVYVHCYVHRLNRVLVDATKDIPLLADLFSLSQKLYCFLKLSVPRHEVFLSEQENDEKSGRVLELQSLSTTRWASRYQSLKTLKTTFGSVLSLLDSISTRKPGSTADERAEASGLLRATKTSSFIQSLIVMERVLGIMNIAHKELQAVKLDTQGAMCLVKASRENLIGLQDPEQGEKIRDDIGAFAEQHGVTLEKTPRRQRPLPVHLVDYEDVPESGVHMVDDIDVASLLEQAIERMVTELDNRFGDEASSIMLALRGLSPDSDAFLDFETLKPLVSLYGNIPTLDFRHLEAELTVAKQQWKRAPLPPDESGMFSKVMQYFEPMKNGLQGLNDLLKLACTLPVTSATCERSMSALRRIKTWQRSTMGEEELSSQALLSIEKELTDSIDTEKIMDAFGSTKKRIRNLI